MVTDVKGSFDAWAVWEPYEHKARIQLSPSTSARPQAVGSLQCWTLPRKVKFTTNGFNPVEDAITYGRDVIPLVHQEVQRRERQTATVA